MAGQGIPKMKAKLILCWNFLFAVNLCYGGAFFTVQEIVLLDDDGRPMRDIPIEASTVTGWVPGTGFGKDIVQRVSVTTDAEWRGGHSSAQRQRHD